MNSTDDLDRRLRTWMTAVSPPSEPVDVVPRAMARAAAVRQRPALGLPVRIGRDRTVAPTFSPALLAAVVGLLVIAIIGTALVGSEMIRPVVRPAEVVRPAVPIASGASTIGRIRWSEANLLAVGRFMHTATLLPDGRVLIVGGMSDSGVMDAAEIWDPISGRSIAVGPMNSARYAHTATLFDDGRVLIAGGATVDPDGAEVKVAAAELFDPASGAFRDAGEMVFGRGWCHCGPSAAVMARPRATRLADGRVLIVGGQAEQAGRPTEFIDPAKAPAEIFDPVTGSFTATPSPLIDLSRASVATLADGRALIVAPDGAIVFDPASDSWMTRGARTADNSDSAVVLRDGRVLVTGPAERDYRTPAEIFSPATNRFGELPDGWNPYGQGVLLADGRVLFANATSSFAGAPAGPSVVVVFDPTTETFATIDTPTAWGNATTTVLQDGRVLIVGPEHAFIFDPAAAP